MSVSQETVCKCGKMKFWLTEGKITKDPCPVCGRKYVGKYNRKTLGLDAIEQISGETVEAQKI